MQIKKIFLASSEELKEDRRAFELMLARLNRDWRQRDVNFDLVVWENFIDAMSKEGLQKEYNKAIEECDIFVMMFFTKVGRYTLEEFETAFADLKTGKGPLIYTFFRNDVLMTGELDEQVKSLLDFKARLRALNHYPTMYRNSEDLQWQFSRQLEKLYAGDGAATFEISDSTPQWRIGEVALSLANRQLHGDVGAAGIDVNRMTNAIQRSSLSVRYAIMSMAQTLRRETWYGDKYRMERTIPVFMALIQAVPNWHDPYGQLGYALKDKLEPDWKGALSNLEKAIQLRGSDVASGYYYSYCKALCLIKLDENFARREPADARARATIVAALKVAARDLADDWEPSLGNADAADIKAWLALNGSPRIR